MKALSMKFLPLLASLLRFAASSHDARADNALIWQFSKSSDVSYLARIGAACQVTAILAKASRSDDRHWQTSLAVEQKLRETITLSAGVDRVEGKDRTARVRADWRYSW